MINSHKHNFSLAVILCSLLIGISSCAQAQDLSFSKYRANENREESKLVLDDSQALQAQADHAIKREITVTARVKKTLHEDVEGLPHQRFLIELSNGSTILIAHDLKYAAVVPIRPGNVVRIHGEYIWNKLGGLIHWTHHSDTPKHESGYIDFDGLRYE